MLHLWCDIDSTVNNHAERIRRNSVKGRILPSAFSHSEIMKDTALPGSVEALTSLGRIARVHFLTARNFDDAYSITSDWLNANRFVYDDLFLVRNHEDKPAFLKNQTVDLFVDDMTVGQESIPFVRYDLIEQLTVPYERFVGDWNSLEKKYLRKLPNGEFFLQFMSRNLNWWKQYRREEETTRKPYYNNFLFHLGVDYDAFTQMSVCELGAGPFGGMLETLPLKAREKIFVDILAEKQAQLRFIEWPRNCRIIECPFEEIELPSDSVDVTLSYNSLDHGWDIEKALYEALRITRSRILVAFDCKSGKNPPHDKVDHYQEISFDQIKRLASEVFYGHRWDLFDLQADSPRFEFAHNNGAFPIACLDVRL